MNETRRRWIPVPRPAVVLVAAAVIVEWTPVPEPSPRTAQRVVTVCLVAILFEGGMHIGWGRLRRSLRGVLTLGLAGTLLTALAAAGLVHLLLGVGWYFSVLVATAVAPTDPAVVFSVLGVGEIAGPSGTVVEGESGANDPVGIALMAALLSAGGLTAGALAQVAGTFTMQMGIGLLVGAIGSRVLRRVMGRLRLSRLVRLALLALGVGAVYGMAALAHGSGFLAVFVAGVLLGDQKTSPERPVMGVLAAAAGVAEIVGFGCLGLTVDLDVLVRTDVWLPGLVLGLLLAVVVRPLVSWPLLRGAGLSHREEAFVMFAGLKGAVPLLLGTMLLPLAGGDRLYGVVVVVVLVSVIGQGTLVPTVARSLDVTVAPLEDERP